MSLSSSSAAGQTTRWVLVAIITVIILVATWLVRNILLLALASVILVVLVTMPIRLLVRRGMPRTPATLISLVGILVFLAILLLVAFPSLIEQFSTLATVTVPTGIRELIDSWNSGEIQQQYPFLESIDRESLNLEALVNSFGTQIADAAGQLGASVLPVVSGLASTILSLLIVIFLSMYFLADPKMHEEGVVKLFPLWYRDRMREIIARLDATLRGWLQATLLSMVFVGVGTWIGLTLLGIQQAAALGVLAGLLSFVPNFGPILALIPSIAVGIVQAEGSLWVIVLIIYGMSFLQSQVVGPLLVSESISMPPVLVLMGQLISVVFFGFIGIMLSVPITAILMVLVQEIYIKDVLGDRVQVREDSFDDELMADGV